MSIERRQRKKGSVWLVRWRDHGRSRLRTFDRKRDAEAFEAQVRLAKRQDVLGQLDAGRQPLKEFFGTWWRLYAEQHLAARTRIMYADLRDRLLIPRLGELQLRRITPEAVQRLQVDLRSEGVGEEMVRKALVLLQSVMERAVEWGHVHANPVKPVRKPRQARKRAVRALPPEVVEAIRARLRLRDAVLVSVMAYSGLRPSEALALRWGDVRQSVLLVERALALGEVQPTKTRRVRSVRLLRPLRDDLLEWRMASGRPDDEQWVFPMRDGRAWTDTATRNWRRRIFNPAAKAAGVSAPRPYDLRHSFVSLMLAEGISVVEIAEEVGNSPSVCLNTYGHVIRELKGQERRSAEDLVRAAREDEGVKNVSSAAAVDPSATLPPT
jgi:integrase